MNILLLGYEGYLGVGLSAYLKPRHHVVGWGREECLFSLTAADLAREKIDVLINCAVETDLREVVFKVDSRLDEINVAGARHLAKLLQGSDIVWFQISTKEVFGPVYGPKTVVEKSGVYRPKMLIGDDQPFAPHNAYAKSKLMSEIIAESHGRANVIRLSTCYTDFNHRRGNWMVNMIKASLERKLVPVTSGGKQFRDPLHVDDLGRLIEAMSEKRIYGQKLNAGGGEKNIISILEFLRLAAPEAEIKDAPGGDYGFAFDNARVRTLVGWEPRILFRDRIGLIVEDVRKNQAALHKKQAHD
ncbi:MAG: sugar nucleotide-binding protein [Elusimicrobiota bacterium]